MALHHSTEYSVDGGAWVMAVPDEEAGPGKSLTPVGLLSGTYSIRLRITPLTGGGAAVVSDPVVYVVAAGADGHQVQLVQYQASVGLSGNIGASVQNQKQAQAAQSSLQFIGGAVEAQSVQSQTASVPDLNTLGAALQNQSTQTENMSSSVIYYATVANNQASQSELSASALNLSGTVSESQSVQTEAIVSSLRFSAVAVQNQAVQTSSYSGTVSAANASPTFTQQPTFTSADPYNITFAYGTADADGDHYLREVSADAGTSWYMATVADETPGSGKSVSVNVGGSGATSYGIKVRITPLAGNTTPVYSNTVTMYTTCLAPTLSVAAGNAQNTLTWAAVTGGLSYSAYWTSNGDAPSATQPTDSTHGKLTAISSGYVHMGLANGTTYKYALVANNAGGDSPLSVAVSATPSAAAYPIAISNGASVTTAPFNLTASIVASGSIQQNAVDTFTVDDSTSIGQGAMLYNSTAWSGTYSHTIKISNLGSIATGAMWIPILSTVPAISDIVTVLTNKKFRFGIIQDGGVNQGKVYASYVNTSGTEYFLQPAGGWSTSLSFFSPAGGGMQLRIAKDATNYTLTIMNLDGSAITNGSGSVAISSVKNGSVNDYIALGDVATDYKAKATIQILS